MLNYRIRKAILSDARSIWKIRNHAKMRTISGTQGKISFKDHEQWFKNKYFKGGDNRCYLLELDNIMVGYCRFDFDPKEKCFNISIAIKYGYQGRGYGNLLLDKSIRRIRNKQGMIAKIMKTNKHSLHLFQKNKFVIFKDDKEFFYLKYEH